MRNEPFDEAKGILLDSERNSFESQKESFGDAKETLSETRRGSAGERVCLFGGSFNPVHNGHLAVARAALQTELVDKVWFMVSPQNPFKQNQTLLDDAKRLEMVRVAVEDEPRMKASDYEFRLPRPSYTWHTLQALRRDYPDTEFSLLIGGDNWAKFSDWFHAQDILASHRIMVYPRSGADFDCSQLPPGVTLLDVPMCDISSTLIREKLHRGESVEGLMPQRSAKLAMEYYR